MKPEELKKMIREQIDEALSSQYNTLDKVLNALLAGKITKTQAKKFIKDLNTKSKPSTGMPAFDDTFGCGSLSSKRTKNYDDYCSSGGGGSSYGGGVRGC